MFTEIVSAFLSALGFFDLAFTCSSSWLMVCVAFERFCAVWLPHQNRILFTHRRVFFLVLTTVIVSSIISTWFMFVVKMITKSSQDYLISSTHAEYVDRRKESNREDFINFNKLYFKFHLEIKQVKNSPAGQRGEFQMRTSPRLTIRNAVLLTTEYTIRWEWCLL